MKFFRENLVAIPLRGVSLAVMLVSRAIRTLLPAFCVPIVANKRAELAVYTTYTLHTCPLWL